nr:MAG TPA: hypothetical protein [Caudoviricetes sp.]
MNGIRSEIGNQTPFFGWNVKIFIFCSFYGVNI